MEEQEINNLKCNLCGKLFTTMFNIERHKNRKIPCLIREVPEADKNNPNRCMHCNKIFVQKQGLNRHYKTCKLKNGEIEIPDDKIKYEQEIRILKEQHIDNKKIDILSDKVHELEKIVHELNPNNATNNTINNYLTPSIDHLIDHENPQNSKFVEIFRKLPPECPLELARHIWFDPNVPENHSIFVINKSTGETAINNGTGWSKKSFHEGVGMHMIRYLFDIVISLYEQPKFGLTPHYDGSVAGLKIRRDNNLLLDHNKLLNICLDNRDKIEKPKLLKKLL